MLMRIAEGFMRARLAALIMPRVSGKSGRWRAHHAGRSPSRTNRDSGIIMLEVAAVAKLRHQPVKRMIGRFIVADPAICHGQPTFRGTRILVADVLEQVAAGSAWETIVEDWRGNVSSHAISEAVRLASQAFRDHSDQYAAPEYVLERAQA